MQTAAWTRRRLLKSTGLGLAGVASSHAAVASVMNWLAEPSTAVHSQCGRFRYALGNTPSQQGVAVLARYGQQWRRTQFVPSAAPSALALSQDGRTLFVANRIEQFGYLPTGSVESWSIHNATGTLRLRNRKGLALMAKHPTELAASCDGSALVVLAGEGTIYTLLSVNPDGELGEVTAVRKELALLPASEHSLHLRGRSLCFTPEGRLLAVDLHTQTLSTFACSPSRMQLTGREPLSPAAQAAFLHHRRRSPFSTQV